GKTAARPAASTSAYDAPARAASSIASQIRATASGALSARPVARWRRASSAAEKISSRSSSQSVRRIRQSYGAGRRLTRNPTVAYHRGTVEAVFAAVADPTRRALLERLRERGPLSISDLSEGLPITRQAVTKHLEVLRASGLISARRAGRERIHELDAEPLRAVDDWLRPYAEAWDERLAALRRHLGEDDR